MCESNAYLINQDKEEEIMEDVQFLDIQGDDLVLRNLFGVEKRLRARVRTINFARHKILLEVL